MTEQNLALPALELRNLGKKFGAFAALKDLNVTVSAGAFVAIVGPSGCGKSTLLRLIAGLETSTSGEIILEGENVTEASAAERGLAMVFQSYALYPHKTVRDNMGFALKIAKCPKAEIEERVAEAARALQLEPLLDRLPKSLSGGQKQRVAIGRAIVRKPKIFLFDEPLSNLDAALRAETRIEIAELHQRLDATMIYVTHDQVEAMTLADQIIILDAGEIQQVGPPKELYKKPANVFVAGFIGSPRMNLISGDIKDGTFRASNLILKLSTHIPDGPVTLGIRPESLVIADAKFKIADINVAISEYLGDESILHGRLDDGTPITVSTRLEIDTSNHKRVSINIDDLDSVHLFSSKDGKRIELERAE